MLQMERLNKRIAQSGKASRRKADELIKAGHVKVNGKIVTELGYMVDDKDEIMVDNVIALKEEHVYFVLNKPTGYITTVSDEKGRRTVMDLIKEKDKQNRIFPVGRLDYDTAGVLLLTNDGEFSQLLTSPKGIVEKEYLARVKGIVTEDELRTLCRGVTIDNGYKTKKAKAFIVSKDTKNDSTLVDITITEGKNHQVRLMMKAIGHEVKKLTRIRQGVVTIEGIKKGEYRPLKIHEVKQLYALAKTKVKEETDVKKQIKRGSTDYLGNTRKKTE